MHPFLFQQNAAQHPTRSAPFKYKGLKDIVFVVDVDDVLFCPMDDGTPSFTVKEGFSSILGIGHAYDFLERIPTAFTTSRFRERMYFCMGRIFSSPVQNRIVGLEPTLINSIT